MRYALLFAASLPITNCNHEPSNFHEWPSADEYCKWKVNGHALGTSPTSTPWADSLYCLSGSEGSAGLWRITAPQQGAAIEMETVVYAAPLPNVLGIYTTEYANEFALSPQFDKPCANDGRLLGIIITEATTPENGSRREVLNGFAICLDKLDDHLLRWNEYDSSSPAAYVVDRHFDMTIGR